MQIHPLTDRISVTAQIEPSDIPALVAQGFRSIINNRPDGEAPDQPANAELEARAHEAGLAWRYIPVAGQPPESQVKAFAEALADLPSPVLAFCRSGTRSSMMWALQAEGTADAIVQTAQAAGYDLSPLRPRLGFGGIR